MHASPLAISRDRRAVILPGLFPTTAMPCFGSALSTIRGSTELQSAEHLKAGRKLPKRWRRSRRRGHRRLLGGGLLRRGVPRRRRGVQLLRARGGMGRVDCRKLSRLSRGVCVRGRTGWVSVLGRLRRLRHKVIETEVRPAPQPIISHAGHPLLRRASPHAASQSHHDEAAPGDPRVAHTLSVVDRRKHGDLHPDRAMSGDRGSIHSVARSRHLLPRRDLGRQLPRRWPRGQRRGHRRLLGGRLLRRRIPRWRRRMQLLRPRGGVGRVDRRELSGLSRGVCVRGRPGWVPVLGCLRCLRNEVGGGRSRDRRETRA